MCFALYIIAFAEGNANYARNPKNRETSDTLCRGGWKRKGEGGFRCKPNVVNCNVSCYPRSSSLFRSSFFLSFFFFFSFFDQPIAISREIRNPRCPTDEFCSDLDFISDESFPELGRKCSHKIRYEKTIGKAAICTRTAKLRACGNSVYINPLGGIMVNRRGGKGGGLEKEQRRKMETRDNSLVARFEENI